MRKALLLWILSIFHLLAYAQSGRGPNLLDSIQSIKKTASDFFSRGDLAKAQEYSFVLLQLAEKANDPYEEAVAANMVAHILNNSNQATKGIEYTRRAIKLLPRIHDPNQNADLYNKLSKRYMWHYQDTKTKSSLDSSALLSHKAIQLARIENLPQGILAISYNNLQGVEWELGNLDKALIYLDSSKLYIEPSSYGEIRLYYSDKADIYLTQHKLEEARRNVDSSLKYAYLDGSQSHLAGTLALAAEIAKEQGDYKTAYEKYYDATTIDDSIRTAERVRVVTELEKKYNQSQNENRIKDLDSKRQLYLFFAIAGLLAAIAIGFYLRQQSLKHKKDILETEQRLNRARMNPHFFFNALTALQQFAIQEKDGKAVAVNLSRFSKIMRETLESTYKEYVTIEQELDFLREYLEVQKIRFPQKFIYTLTPSPDLEIDELLIPAMILQPFIENSIEHGFAGIDHVGELIVHFERANNDLVITIRDNGKGMAGGAKDNNEHISRASQIIRDRIYLLNIKLKSRAGFHIDNDPSGKGVVVTIHLPILYKENA